MAQRSQVSGPFYAVFGGKISKNNFGFFKGFFLCVFFRNVQEMNFCLAQEQGSIVTVLREGWKVTSKGNI